jgi:hypothetical protein
VPVLALTVTPSCGRVGTAILARVTDQDQSQPEAAANAPLVTPPGTALDPMVSLATSVHASPGVYALLLGSGVSTGAGVLTGWEVVKDLVRKVAAAQAPDDVDAADQVGMNRRHGGLSTVTGSHLGIPGCWTRSHRPQPRARRCLQAISSPPRLTGTRA